MQKTTEVILGLAERVPARPPEKTCSQGEATWRCLLKEIQRLQLSV
jgi:hypothetical protein